MIASDDKAPEPVAAAPTSHREILRATSITGAASVLNILISIVRTKVLALLIGPAGVGLFGLFSRVLGTASMLAGMGLSHSGVRQLAAATDDPAALARVRKALWYASLALGALGMLVMWLLRAPIADLVFGDTARASEVAWLGLGLMLTLITTSQTALLQGLRRIGDMARVSVLGAITGSILAVVLAWQLHLDGVVWMVVFMPLASALVAALFVARLPRATPWRPKPRELWTEWRSLFGLGVAVMAATVLSSLAQLATRSLTTDAIDMDATGHFEAAWAISMTYIGFVLTAMGADYYPRLTAAVADRASANRLVNEQAEVALILAAPVLVGIVSFAPVVIHLLYSAEFEPAIEVLQLQVLGDVLKVAAWPMGFILLARSANRAFFLTELLWNAVYVGSVALLLPAIGLAATGAAFIIGYVFYTAMIYFVVARLQGFRPTRRVVLLLLVTLMTAVAVFVVSRLEPSWGLVVGAVATIVTGIHSLRALLAMLALEGRLGRMVARLARLLRWPRR